jgi:cell division protein FtsL
LVFTVLAVLTFVGLARVHVRTQLLELGEEITELTEEQKRLLDRKRRLQTERAYLRHPGRVHEYAAIELGMQPAPADRIQRIQLSAPPEQKPDE